MRFLYFLSLVVLHPLVHAQTQAPFAFDIAATYGVLASGDISNTGATRVDGNVATIGGSIIGFDPAGTVGGTGGDATGTTSNPTVDNQAYTQASAAYTSLQGTQSTTDLSGTDLGGLTLTAGVYTFTSSAQLTGTLTLTGSTTDVFIFQIGSTLTTATAAAVLLTGGAQACNVFFQVGSSATLGSGTAFNGNVLAAISITAVTATSVNGGLYALNGAITLDTNTINAQTCAAVVTTTTSTPAAATTAPATGTTTVTVGSSTTTVPGPGTTTATVTVGSTTTTAPATGTTTATVIVGSDTTTTASAAGNTNGNSPGLVTATDTSGIVTVTAPAPVTVTALTSQPTVTTTPSLTTVLTTMESNTGTSNLGTATGVTTRITTALGTSAVALVEVLSTGAVTTNSSGTLNSSVSYTIIYLTLTTSSCNTYTSTYFDTVCGCKKSALVTTTSMITYTSLCTTQLPKASSTCNTSVPTITITPAAWTVVVTAAATGVPSATFPTGTTNGTQVPPALFTGSAGRMASLGEWGVTGLILAVWWCL